MRRATPKVDRLHRYWLTLARRAAQMRLEAMPPALSPPVPSPLPGDPLEAPQPLLPAPPRLLVDPADIFDLLPNLLLVDFETNPFRVRFRLTGTLVDEASGVNLTGSYLDEFDDGKNAGAFGPVIADYRLAWQRGEAVIGVYPWITQNGHDAIVCYGIFPLTVDGRVTQAIAIEEYDPTLNIDPLMPLQHH
jgi:hypothetical protein